MSQKATRQPCPAKRVTIAAPMPDPPPDTNTVLPVRLGYDTAGRSAGMFLHPSRRICARSHGSVLPRLMRSQSDVYHTHHIDDRSVILGYNTRPTALRRFFSRTRCHGPPPESVQACDRF